MYSIKWIYIYSVQWAAVNTQRSPMIDPPQLEIISSLLFTCKDTCHGIFSMLVSNPPTIKSLGSLQENGVADVFNKEIK